MKATSSAKTTLEKTRPQIHLRAASTLKSVRGMSVRKRCAHELG